MNPEIATSAPPLASAQSPSRTFLFQINVTRDCNLRCTHCYIASEVKAISGRLTTSQFLKIVKDIGEFMSTAPHDHAEIHVVGGEPTMLGAAYYARVMPRAREILSEYGDSFSWEFSLISNLLSRELQEIAPWFDRINTAYEPKTRFPKPFHEKWWLDGVRALQDRGLDVSVSTCMTRPVIEQGAANVCDWLHYHLGINQIHFGFYIESGDGRANARDVTPTFRQTSRFLVDAATWYFARRETTPDLWVNPVESLLSAIHRNEPFDDIVCPIIPGSLDIDSSGNAMTCLQAGGEIDPPWEGNVLETSVSDVVNGAPFRRSRIRAARPQPICMSCREYPVCRSGCGVNFRNWSPDSGDDCPGYKEFISHVRSLHEAGLRPRDAGYRGPQISR